MQYNPLGTSSIQVSRICLGTMTFGEQNEESQAHAQMDLVFERGVNFFDTAEMYPIPPRAETQGRTETHIGNWLARSGRRDQIILATKATGPGDWMAHIRSGPRLNERHIREALHGSLQRLRTDYVDLYQLHWPERRTNFFGRLGYEHQPEQDGVPIEETLNALAKLVEEGKVRTIGVSNETPWGVMAYLRLAEQQGGPRIVSIQNPYNLLNRTFEIGLAEIAHREKVGLLAYSPLAFGVLSGKYLDGKRPEGARLSLFSGYSRYSKPHVEPVVRRYVELARQHGLNPAQMALAYVNSRPFLTANIIGATTPEQLTDNLDSLELELPAEIIAEIEEIHRQCPNVAP
ncbi:MAG: NADP(H)-dependent aldo-keto reductase [Methylohalobius sp. ZOD2]|nr:NADP(H)-dependent aldo-keto reductase [Methylothermaceae bacterium]